MPPNATTNTGTPFRLRNTPGTEPTAPEDGADISVQRLADFEEEVMKYRETNRTLRRQVHMFQALMRDRPKLNQVIARLEKENLISNE